MRRRTTTRSCLRPHRRAGPRAERILEYLLMGEGKYKVEAQIAPTSGGVDGGASVQAGEGRTRRSRSTGRRPDRIRKMLATRRS